MRTWLRGILSLGIIAMILGIPAAYYRASYAHAKRFREVSPGKVYRSGQLTASGLRDVIHRHNIRTVINLQEEARDPLLPETWQARPSIRESDICQQLGIRYVALDGGVLAPPGPAGLNRPPVIDEFLELLDDPENYPVLIHCKAGLHRTGLLTAVYRMEYDGWSVADAVEELRANGFGTFAATAANLYVQQFILNYERGVRRRRKPCPAAGEAQSAKPEPKNPAVSARSRSAPAVPTDPIGSLAEAGEPW